MMQRSLITNINRALYCKPWANFSKRAVTDTDTFYPDRCAVGEG